MLNPPGRRDSAAGDTHNKRIYNCVTYASQLYVLSNRRTFYFFMALLSHQHDIVTRWD